jgi:hypothetical protein
MPGNAKRTQSVGYRTVAGLDQGQEPGLPGDDTRTGSFRAAGTMTPRRLPPPWTVIEHTESFWVQDARGQTVGWFYFRTDPLVAKTAGVLLRTKRGGWR